ncbi:DUF1127 domain-containing protein [Mesorhizobium sp. M1C.F.Ca.ET.193.01.1.1]|uniref:DUF1127 domain-containing protein n=1 Tax=unclassified Mesorhizobium TaxID=325217 RepID=UPI000FD39F31|nr:MULTISPECIES: DUF1127 domain-containing protein [unclassified Mesorhizobium]TGT00205.1 DUF1127 domain-containing protein [bacterium M00.F.Ca.ET.177.01.1.1]RWA70685.1 MAG: DUF1127 domain-containing protein [Mesorhizobium sp.]RWC03142.1 MAG: DUF1127 domain-containing protein [Mesorhizobium sp.]RWG80838.1 MAG: DUF1127 domain-containing protein [Mesorhizobium sp.]RWG85987.1 MAG: DUF1127 domain-containing protein [Mesorhizobium sp.]
MAHTETHAKTHASNPWPLGAASKSVTTAVSAFTAWRRSIAGRRAIRDMTPDQLKDIGCQEVPRPTVVIRVGVGLMTDLMSMR